MANQENNIPEILRQYTVKPKADRDTQEKKDIDDYVMPATGKTTNASERIDEIRYGKEA